MRTWFELYLGERLKKLNRDLTTLSCLLSTWTKEG